MTLLFVVVSVSLATGAMVVSTFLTSLPCAARTQGDCTKWTIPSGQKTIGCYDVTLTKATSSLLPGGHTVACGSGVVMSRNTYPINRLNTSFTIWVSPKTGVHGIRSISGGMSSLSHGASHEAGLLCLRGSNGRREYECWWYYPMARTRLEHVKSTSTL